MVHLINLHAHTTMSDGCDSMLTMAEAAADLGHCALVITDHDYFLAWPENFKIVESVRRQSPIPIILGSEVSTAIGECLMFGEENLRQWFELMSPLSSLGPEGRYSEFADASLSFFQNREVKECPLVLCHPYPFLSLGNNYMLNPWNRRWVRRLQSHRETAGFLVGYEGQNGTTLFPKESMDRLFEEIWSVTGLKRYYNSDAHMAESLGCVCNRVDRSITTESELMDYLLNGREPERHIAGTV